MEINLVSSEVQEMIKKAEVKEAKLIAELAIQMWTSHTVEELEEEFRELLKNSECAIYIYYVNHQAVGFAQCQLRHDYVEGTSSSPVGYLEGIFVNEKFRHQGIASALLNACEKWASENQCTEFASDCELTNETSLKFHLALKFEEANRIICFRKKL